MRTTHSNATASTLFGQTRSAVLALLYGHVDQSFYLRQIARSTGISPGALQRELEQLAVAGLVTRTVVGNQVFYQANSAHPVFSEIRSLVAKTVGLSSVLKTALSPLASNIRVAFVYGSIAKQEETAHSDIDLLVVGSVSLDDVIANTVSAQQSLGREINPVTYTVREFKAKLASRNHFVTSVLRGPKLFLIGSEDELRKLGSKRVA